MENYFAASCKRVTNKVSRKIKQRERMRKKLIRLSDGGVVEEWGLGLMDKEASLCDNLFRHHIMQIPNQAVFLQKYVIYSTFRNV